MLIVSCRDCKILWWSPGPGCRWIIRLDCDPGPRLAVEADYPDGRRWTGCGRGLRRLQHPGGPAVVRSSPVSSATSSHSSSSDESIRQVNDRRTTYLIWCAFNWIIFYDLLQFVARLMSIDWNVFSTNWIVFAANKNSYFAQVLLRYQSWNIFCTPKPENLEC